MQDAVASIDPLLPRVSVTTLTREVSMALLPQRVAAIVTGVLGVAGLVLAAIGASRADIVQMVLRRACA